MLSSGLLRLRMMLSCILNRCSHSTKRVARRVCQAYQKKAFLIAMDKSKLLYLTYCLMVLVIALMVVVVILKF